MKKIQLETQDKELELMLDLKAWIEDEDFMPPFPFNVLWNMEEPKHKRLRILAEAAEKAYLDSIANKH